jgi:Tfp pilus assembly protein PilX
MQRISGNQDGFLLVAALTLLSVLILVGGTAVLLSSTDLKIAANFRATESTLQVAMAGTAQAREILRQLNAASTDLTSFTDELPGFKGNNGVLNGYATATDDVPVASGTLNGATYSVYATNDVQDANGQ